MLRMLDALCMPTCFYTACKAYRNVTSCYKEFHFVSFMYVNFPSRLSAGKWKTSKIPFLCYHRSISHTTRPEQTDKHGFRATSLLPKTTTCVSGSMRGGDGVIASTHFTCFHRPILSHTLPYSNESNFEARSSAKEQRSN